MIAVALTRFDVANYVDKVFLVYIILIFIHILLGLMFSMGVRPPYTRWFDAFTSFLRDVVEPYLGLFRRVLPPVGMFDLTPMLALIVLYVLRTVVVNLING